MNYKKRRLSIPEPKQKEYTYEQLYKEYWPKLHMLFYYSINDYHESEDLAQFVMIRVWRYWDRIQWDKLSAAIGVIANNVRYDYLKENFDKPDKEFYEDALEFECHDEGISDPMRKCIIEDAANFLTDFLESLKEEDRDLFVDFYVDDVELNTLCEKHEITKSHVYVKLHRIRKYLFSFVEGKDILPDGEWNHGLV